MLIADNALACDCPRAGFRARLPAGRVARLAAIVVAMVAAATAGPARAEDLTRLPIGDPARRDRVVEVVPDAIVDAARGDVIDPEGLAVRLATTGLVFVGEEHTSQAFHDVQLRVIRALHAAGRPVLIGLEMFPWTRQQVLDDWVAGHYTEEGFLAQADWYDNWGYHWNYYRDIFLYAREHRLRLVAVNSPRPVIRTVRAEGFEALSPVDRARFPPTLAPPSDEHQRLFRAAFAADDSLHMAPAALAGLYRAQLAWDATMGWNAVQALAADGRPDAVMVVLIGSGHVTYGLGSQRQVAPYYAGRMAAIVPVPLPGPGSAGRPVQASYADFVWGVMAEPAPLYPSLGVSLMGPVGKDPTRVIQVAPRSPAARAGVRVGDVLVNVGNAPVDGDAALRRALHPYRWGDVVALAVRRDGEAVTLAVPLRR